MQNFPSCPQGLHYALLRIGTVVAICIFSLPSMAFDLHEAWAAAREHNAHYSAAIHERNAGREAENQGLAGLLPHISVNAQYQRQPQSNNADAQSRGWNIQAQQPLLDLPKWAQYQQGRVAARIADAQFVQNDTQLMLDISKTYFSILQAQDSLTATRAAKEAYAKQLLQVKAMFDVGASTQVDIDEARAGYDTAAAKEIRQLSELNIARNQLENDTGLNPDDIEPLSYPDALQANKILPEKYWQETAFAHSPERALAALQLKNAQAALVAAQGERAPRLMLSAGYQDTHYRNENYGRENRYRSKGNTITASLSMPLFSGGLINSKVTEARERVLQAKDMLLAAERKIALNVKQYYLSVQSGESEILAQEKLVQSTRSKLASTQMGYEVGLRSNLDVVQAQQACADADQQLAATRYNYVMAYLQLLYSAGTLNEENHTQVIRKLMRNGKANKTGT